eukprot:5176516-Pleurochrysis_carterae.AAC.3
MAGGWRGGGPGDLRTPTPDPILLERGLCQPLSTGVQRLRSCNDQGLWEYVNEEHYNPSTEAIETVRRMWEVLNARAVALASSEASGVAALRLLRLVWPLSALWKRAP